MAHVDPSGADRATVDIKKFDRSPRRGVWAAGATAMLAAAVGCASIDAALFPSDPPAAEEPVGVTEVLGKTAVPSPAAPLRQSDAEPTGGLPFVDPVVAAMFATPTATPDPTVEVFTEGHWRVVGDGLATVRQSPDGLAVAALGAAVELEPTGRGQEVDEVMWVEVRLPDGSVGWTLVDLLRSVVPTPTPEPPSTPAPTPTAAPTAAPAVAESLLGADESTTDESTTDESTTDESTDTPTDGVAPSIELDQFEIADLDVANDRWRVTAESTALLIIDDATGSIRVHADFQRDTIVEALSPTGRLVDGASLVRVRHDVTEGWMDLGHLALAAETDPTDSESSGG